MKFSAVMAWGLVIGLSWRAPVFADPPDLMEVNAKNSPQCVEYFTIQGKLYCSSKPMMQGDGGVTEHNYDPLAVRFDQRDWTPVWGKKTPQIVTVEYVVKGDDVKHWKELVTSQFFPGLENRPMPAQFAEGMINKLKSQAPAVQTQYLKQTPGEVIFEFRIGEPAEMTQDEIQRIFMKDNGIYVLHYVMRVADMGAKTRSKWVNLLKQATPK